MDKAYVEENNITQKYLQGLLTPEEVIEFEVYFMDKPELVEELELESLLKRHFDLRTDEKERGKSWLSWFLVPSIKYVVVSSVAFAFGILVYKSLFLPNSLGTIDVFNVAVVRSVNTAQASYKPIEFTEGLSTLIIKLQFDDEVARNYVVKVTQNQKDIFSAREITTNNDGDVFVPLPTSKLKSGTLKVFYSPVGEKVVNQNIEVKVTKIKSSK